MESATLNGSRVDGIDYAQIARDLSKDDLVIVDPKTGVPVTTTRDTIVGLLVLLNDAGRKVGNLSRRLTEDGHIDSSPAGKDIKALIDRWKEGTGKKHAKAGANRVKLVKARLKDKFPMRLEEGEDPQPTLELAVDGLCAYPYRQFDQRMVEGTPSQKHDDLEAALKDEKHVEQMARLGWKARAKGWTIDAGWPEEADPYA